MVWSLCSAGTGPASVVTKGRVPSFIPWANTENCINEKLMQLGKKKKENKKKGKKERTKQHTHTNKQNQNK